MKIKIGPVFACWPNARSLSPTEQERLRQYEAESKEAAAHISQSKQFQQLKVMLNKKNEQLTHLRKRLLKYEPDAVEGVEDEE